MRFCLTGTKKRHLKWKVRHFKSKLYTWKLGKMDPTLTKQFYMAQPPPATWEETTWKNGHGALAACGLKKVFIFKDLFPLQTSFNHTTVATCGVGQLYVRPWDPSFETIVHSSRVQFGQKHHDFRWTFHLVTVLETKQQSTKEKTSNERTCSTKKKEKNTNNQYTPRTPKRIDKT